MQVLSERWRKLSREVAIIVLGVLIALVFGEMATAVRNRIEAHRAMRAVREDMIDNATSFDLTPLILNCNEKRLNSLAGIIFQARSKSRIPDIGDIPARGGNTFRTGAWERAVANGNVLFVDQSEIADISDYHAMLAIYRNEWSDMALAWARLGVLTHSPGHIDDNTLAMARQTIAELRFHSKNIRMINSLLLDTHKSLGYPIIYGSFNNIRMSKMDRIKSILNGETCRQLQVNDNYTDGEKP